MAGVYTVYNIGTGHTSNEENQTMLSLHQCTTGLSKLNEGITGKLIYESSGRGQNPRRRATIDEILEARPNKLNMAGHSRGGTLCYLIANELTELSGKDPGKGNKSEEEKRKINAAKGIVEINIITLDPVNMSTKTKSGTKLYMNKVNSHVSIIMENATDSIFPSNIVEPRFLDGKKSHESFSARNRMTMFNMPGSHGSGTQWMTSAIGKVCRGMCIRFLKSWGTTFRESDVPDEVEMATLFAKIHRENPLVLDEQTGKPVARLIHDDKGGHGKKSDMVDLRRGFVGRKERMRALDEIKMSSDFPNNSYFFNTYHLSMFSQSFPALAGYMAGKRVCRDSVRGELANMKVNHPKIYRSFPETVRRIAAYPNERLVDRPVVDSNSDENFPYG